MPSRASSTTSNVIRSTTKRKLDDSPVKLSELCMRVLIRTVSTHSTLHSDRPLYCYSLIFMFIRTVKLFLSYELEAMCKEAVVANSEVLLWCWPAWI
jgi:hypothetical protein